MGETDHTGTTVTFKPDPEMFDTLDYDYETLHTRMREQAFLNAGLRITITDAPGGAGAVRGHVLRGRHPRVRHLYQPQQDPAARGGHLSLRRQGRQHRRGGHAVQRRLQRDAGVLRQRHPHAGGRHARDRLQGGSDPRAQRLRPEVRPYQGGRQGVRRGRAARASPP